MTGINKILSEISLNSRRRSALEPLASFRIIFGLLMMFSVLRFWYKGWIEELYLKPDFHFKYFGFEWVEALPGYGMYMIFILMFAGAAGIFLGWMYRISSILFFICFTYVELLDVTNYLNHYYFVSLVGFLLIFLPAHKKYSLDVRFKRISPQSTVNWWAVNIIKIQLSLVYLYAGLAKLNPDWLFDALPLRIWLPAHADMPLIGSFFSYTATAYIFSWFGALYDLSIPFFLWNKKTRNYAYLAVIAFHVLTWLLFPIGVFPWVMICSTLIFFSDRFHLGFLSLWEFLFHQRKSSTSEKIPAARLHRVFPVLLAIFLSWQILWPWRFIVYPGQLFWTEQAYRLGWRVMLVEKAGYITYHVHDPKTGESAEADPSEFLTPNQVKQLSTQPDLILQFAHYLEEVYQSKGVEDPVVTAESYVSLNGGGSRPFIDPQVDLSRQKESFKHKDWILPYEN